ncbi:MAG TPA: AGE family epimerase/isomerase [Steroidobacteraceae bacterium]|jgi:mannose-6-phosphate isomerase|nr:AGE family epimerase/isomerase [Steroidobacteraceae bacterium]
MTSAAGTDPVAVIHAAQGMERYLLDWLVNDAYPRWAAAGVEMGTGGFVECLDQDGTAITKPRRARVQTRQVYAFAQASELGWQGPAVAIATRGLRYFVDKYRRSDGLYRTLVAVDGTALDDSALLYDQAFALLGMAAVHKLTRSSGEWEQQADALLYVLNRDLKRPNGGFDSALDNRVPLLSNPHMHLFEACLEWRDLSVNPQWRVLADELGALALARFIDSATGVLHERFDETWNPLTGIMGRIVEPGHQFEWAWLLLRWGAEVSEARHAALRLIEIGERAGVCDGVAIDGLLDDFTIQIASARLWPQTERLKAAALAAAVTGHSQHWMRATAAAKALRQYLATQTAGVWRDTLGADGTFLSGPAPAGNLYHIVAAILALTRALRQVRVAESIAQ